MAESVETMELDPRMTEETKEFVRKSSQAINAAFDDYMAWREVEAVVDKQRNSQYKFPLIEEKQFVVENLFDKYEVPVTAFVPLTASTKSPIIVFCHGGGFKLSSTQTYKRSLMHIADRSNKIWVSVDYRYTPQFKYPTQYQDYISVVKWVIENKTKIFKADANAKIGLCGDSAGGNLAVLASRELKDQIGFQILIYPWLDLTLKSDHNREFSKPQYLATEEANKTDVDDYIGGVIEPTSPEVSPLFFDDFKGLPKCLIVVAELDPVTGDGIAYHKKLQDAGVSSRLHVIKGTVHTFFSQYFDYKNAFLECSREIISFLRLFKKSFLV